MGGDDFIGILDHGSEVGILVGGVPAAVDLGGPPEVGLGKVVGGGVLAHQVLVGEGSVSGQHVIGHLEVGDDLHIDIFLLVAGELALRSRRHRGHEGNVTELHGEEEVVETAHEVGGAEGDALGAFLRVVNHGVGLGDVLVELVPEGGDGLGVGVDGRLDDGAQAGVVVVPHAVGGVTGDHELVRTVVGVAVAGLVGEEVVEIQIEAVGDGCLPLRSRKPFAGRGVALDFLKELVRAGSGQQGPCHQDAAECFEYIFHILDSFR